MSRNILLTLHDAIFRFRQGPMSVSELQSRLNGNAQALDRSVGDDLLNELRRLDGALEMIIFTVSADEQRNAALAELEPVSKLIRARLQSPALDGSVE